METITFFEFIQAYKDCRKRKTNTRAHGRFIRHFDTFLIDLHRSVNSGAFEPSAARVFAITNPKPREVWAAQFHDRVVHHAIYNRILDRFHRRFIVDTYACLPDRGVLYGVNRIHKFIRSASEDFTYPVYVLQADLDNFFVSIDRCILETQTLDFVPEPVLRQLLSVIIHHDVANDYILSGDPSQLDLIPSYKSLFYAPAGKGLPIGNLTSQLLANVYLNPLDQFIKHRLKVRYYGRYVDDIILIGKDPEYLCECFKHIQDKAWNTLELKFHPDKTKLLPVEKGVDFCGSRILPYHVLTRDRTLRSLKRVAKEYEDIDGLEQLLSWEQSMNSYLGSVRHARTRNFRKTIGSRYGFSLDDELVKVSPDWRK